MTDGQLVLVLIGGAVAVGAIVVFARPRRRPSGRASARGEQPLPASADDAAAPAASAPPRVQAVRPSSSPQESDELRAVRQETQHQMQVLSFGKVFAPLLLESLGEQPGVTAIRATLAVIAERPNYAPRRPLLLPKLMQAMNDDETSRRDLARIVSTDPALAGSLLRLANSPFYRIQREPVESLDRAIALLGLEGMRSLIASALLQPVFRISGGMYLQFGDITWEHTLYSAGAAEAHAAVLENSDPFAGQLLALIMGLAVIVVFRVATDEYLSRQQSPSPALLGALIETEAAGVGRRIAASWELSERIDTALADQLESPHRMSSLGRSLQMGRFLGALALLHARGMLGEEEVQAALKTTGSQADACLRIWSRLRALQSPS